MASIETRQRADGTTAYRVRYRIKPGTSPTVDTFNTPGDAANFAALVDRLGGEAARAHRQASAGASTRTIHDVLDSYIEAATDVGPGTLGEYRRVLVRSGLGDTFAGVPIELISREDVERWARQRIPQRTQRGNRQISATTVRAEHAVLSMIFRHAIQRGWATVNPAAGIRLPKSQRAELEVLTDREFIAIHTAISDRYKPLVWLLAATGMRWGEATALQWRDVAGTQLTVRQAWKHAEVSHRRVLGPPKTAKGLRRIETTQLVIDSLGERGHPDAFVFVTPAGDPVAYNHFYPLHWKPACKAAGIKPAPRIHGLRHFAASYMLAQGTDIFEVSRALGHGDIGITTRVYGHLVPSKTRPTAVHAARLDGLRTAQIES